MRINLLSSWSESRCMRAENMGKDISESSKVCPNIGNPDMSLSRCNRCIESADPNYKLCLTQRIAPPLLKNNSFEPVNVEIIPSHWIIDLQIPTDYTNCWQLGVSILRYFWGIHFERWFSIPTYRVPETRILGKNRSFHLDGIWRHPLDLKTIRHRGMESYRKKISAGNEIETIIGWFRRVWQIFVDPYPVSV